jgi:hypothetical protein
MEPADRIRELAGLPMFSDLNSELVFLFDAETLERRSERLMVAATKYDCAFDAKFDVLCE